MKFSYKIKERKGKLSVTFKGKPKSWKRFVSRLINDKVVLDIKSARNFLKIKGDKEVYRVFHFESNGLSCDFTLLHHGLFSISKKGEAFLTYGHLHKKYKGEAYSVLRNDCFFELVNKKTFETFIIHLKKGTSIFIHPKFLHRIISHKKDCLVFNFVPEDAGHNYKIIKNKGFPFHLLYNSKSKDIEIVKNKRYRKAKLKFIKKIKTRIDPIKLFGKNTKKLKDILENPNKHKKIYFKGNQS